jgi:hypothetical protein
MLFYGFFSEGFPDFFSCGFFVDSQQFIIFVCVNLFFSAGVPFTGTLGSKPSKPIKSMKSAPKHATWIDVNNIKWSNLAL